MPSWPALIRPPKLWRAPPKVEILENTLLKAHSPFGGHLPFKAHPPFGVYLPHKAHASFVAHPPFGAHIPLEAHLIL